MTRYTKDDGYITADEALPSTDGYAEVRVLRMYDAYRRHAAKRLIEAERDGFTYKGGW